MGLAARKGRINECWAALAQVNFSKCHGDQCEVRRDAKYREGDPLRELPPFSEIDEETREGNKSDIYLEAVDAAKLIPGQAP